MKSFLSSLFATHPPLAQRIQRLDRHWDGKYIQPQAQTQMEQVEQETATPVHATTAAAGIIGAGILQAIDSIGQPSDAHLENANRLLQAIPAVLREAAREPYKARAVIYTLVINDEADIRDAQLIHLKQHGDNGVYAETISLLPHARQLARQLRLPLIDIALGSLRQLSPAQYYIFKTNLQALIEADNNIDLFEWSLQKIVHHHLDNEFEKQSPMRRTAKYTRLAQLRQECVQVVSLLAHTNHGGELVAQKAFDAAAKILAMPGINLSPQARINLASLNTAIDKLAMLTPLAKPQFLKACVACITADNKVSEIETELLRAIANAIDCPIPPVSI